MTLFGGMSYSAQFFLAFVVVLGLIGAIAWGVRRFGTGRFGGVGIRGRQPRLGVIEYAIVDGHRRLILVRRDNVEHLVMVGGPTDIVVEPGIVRAAPTARDVSIARAPAGMETPPRSIRLPDSAGAGSWPLQPEPSSTMATLRTPRSETWPDEQTSWPLQPQAEAPTAPARTQRDTLAALADELSSRPVPPRSRPQANARSQSSEQRSEPWVPPAQREVPEPANESDRSLAEMTHRLEAALRKPHPKTDIREARTPAAPSLPVAPPPDEHAPAPAATERGAHAAETRSRADGKPQKPGQALYDSLEQEMASLLGRPAGKD